MLLGIWSEAATGPERYLGVDGKVYYSEELEVVQAYVAYPIELREPPRHLPHPGRRLVDRHFPRSAGHS